MAILMKNTHKLILLAILCTGCGGSLETARTAGMHQRPTGAKPEMVNAYCRKVDSQRATWGAIAKGSGFVAGASGVSTIPVGDDQAAQTAVVSTAVVAGVVTVASVYMTESKASTWARECSER